MPSWKDLKRFCERDGWELYKQTDHFYYRKVMPDGQTKRTKVSISPGEMKLNPGRKILPEQLKTHQEYFTRLI